MLYSSLNFEPPPQPSPFSPAFGAGRGNLEAATGPGGIGPRSPHPRRRLARGGPARPTGSRGESHLGAGSGERQPLAGRLPRTKRIPREGANQNRPERGRHETGEVTLCPGPPRAPPSRPRHPPPSHRPPHTGPGSSRASRSLLLRKQNLQTEVMENFIRYGSCRGARAPPALSSVFAGPSLAGDGLLGVSAGKGRWEGAMFSFSVEESKPGPSPPPPAQLTGILQL